MYLPLWEGSSNHAAMIVYVIYLRDVRRLFYGLLSPKSLLLAIFLFSFSTEFSKRPMNVSIE